MQCKEKIDIGRRAFEFINAQPEGVTAYCKRVGIPCDTAYGWTYGKTPSAYYLQKLHFLGADVIYILTGEGSNDER